MSPEQKIQNVEAQIRAVEAGRTNLITCPYCETQLQVEDEACCPTFEMAVAAVLDRLETQDDLDKVAKIADKISEGSKLVN